MHPGVPPQLRATCQGISPPPPPARAGGKERTTGQLTLPGGSKRDTVPNPGSSFAAGRSILPITSARGTSSPGKPPPEDHPKMDNYIPVLTKARRPLAPCHPNRAKSLVKAGKARFITRYGIRCIILNKTAVPKLKTRCRVQLRVKPGAAVTGIAITLEHPDGSRSVLMALQIEHRGRTITKALIKRRQRRRNRRYRKTATGSPGSSTAPNPKAGCPPALSPGCPTPSPGYGDSARFCPSPTSTSRPPSTTPHSSATRKLKARSTSRAPSTKPTCGPPSSTGTDINASTAVNPANATGSNWTTPIPKL